MHRCNCSTRAIETFVKDLGGIAIRQQRAQRFFQHYRSLSTRRPLRQLQTTVGANTDDAFIPFDFEAARRKREGVRRAEKINDDYQQDEEALESGRDDGSNHGEEEWHAEVEIKSPDAPATGTHDRRMDEVRFQALLAEEGQTDASSTPAVPILNLPAISQHIRPKTAPKEDGSTDADASLEKISPRIMRKFRRIEEGKYNRLQTTSSKATGSDVDGSVEEVLEIIEGMQGPSLAKNEKKMKQKASSEDNDGARTGKTKGEPKAAVKTSKAKDKSETTIATTTRPIKAPKKERWQVDKATLKQKFGDQGWKPRKRLSPDTLEGIRALHSSDPATYSTQTLAANFQVTPEAIRRILKSKWQPSAEDSAKRMERWEKRGLKKWAEMAEQGMRPPKKWRAMGVGKDGDEGDERKTGNGRKGKEVNSWDDAVEAAGRLPMEGSFADRIL